MKIFRYKKDRQLYKIHYVVRPTCMCETNKKYYATPLYHPLKHEDGVFVTCQGGLRVDSIDDFEVVAER